MANRSRAVFLLVTFSSMFAWSQSRPRSLGIPFDGTPGPLNAITDVSGVEVGFATIVRGSGKLVPGTGPVRTGVTVIMPHGKDFSRQLFAAWETLNGNGEMTGTTWVQESGFLGGPVCITNTHSVGVVRDAVIEWIVKKYPREGKSGDLSLPVVAETWDEFLNDINGFHVTREHVVAALEGAKGGPVAEGNVGGGTGMIAFGFKGGTGTSSRVLAARAGGYTVGVLVQANFGRRQNLRIAGIPVGREITDLMPAPGTYAEEAGSIIVVVATDAPLLPHQLKRITKRVSLGVGNVGGRGENSSGDIFIAFSTANANANIDTVAALTMLANDRITPLFEATVQATEEAIVNAMFAAETMEGVNGNTVSAIPRGRVVEILKQRGVIR